MRGCKGHRLNSPIPTSLYYERGSNGKSSHHHNHTFRPTLKSGGRGATRQLNDPLPFPNIKSGVARGTAWVYKEHQYPSKLKCRILPRIPMKSGILTNSWTHALHWLKFALQRVFSARVHLADQKLLNDSSQKSSSRQPGHPPP